MGKCNGVMQILVALIHVYTLLTTYFTPDSNINNQQCISTGVRSEVAKYKTCLYREIAVVTGDFYICLLFFYRMEGASIVNCSLSDSLYFIFSSLFPSLPLQVFCNGKKWWI